MHAFLPAIGFSSLHSSRDVRPLLDTCLHFPESSSLFRSPAGSCGYLSKSYGDHFGLRLYVEYEAGKKLQEEYYFPYADTDIISTRSECTVERLSDRHAYGGMTEEPTLGLSLIFFLNNGMEYARRRAEGHDRIAGVALTGLSTEGKILLPLRKTERQKAMVTAAIQERSRLMEAARGGDAAAMDDLTSTEMDLAQAVTDHIRSEDVYSIVDTCFMPSGLESDRYTVIGEIRSVEYLKNILTGEELVRMVLDCNDIPMGVLINRQDLLGEPAAGRRFKGDIWMQGRAIFE